MQNVNLYQYNAFYKENKRRLYFFIFKMTRDANSTEELVNDVFVKIYQKWDTFDAEKASMKTWAYNIAANATIDHLRKRRLQTKSMQDVLLDNDGDKQEEMQFASEDSDPLERLITTESHRNIAAAIKQLPAIQQEIITQCASGIPYDEIANDLNMPIGTVKCYMHQARKQMREMFNKPELV